MKRIQKISWFIVICVTIAVVCTITAVGIIYHKYGFGNKLRAGFAFLSIAGIGGLAPLFFGKDAEPVEKDERDIMINRRAALAGFGMSYLFVGLACMLPFTIMGPRTKIDVSWLPLIFVGAGLTSFYVHAWMILIQYGLFPEKGGADGQGE